MTNNRLEQILHAPEVTAWSGVFAVEDVETHRAEVLVRELHVRRNDVLTAKLTETVLFYRAAEAGEFSILPGCIRDLNKVLDIYCILSTFDNLARAELAPFRKPVFEIRVGERCREYARVLPLDMAAILCGLEQPLLRASLTSLIKDDAIRIVYSPEGQAGILIESGFIIDNNFRRHYQYRARGFDSCES